VPSSTARIVSTATKGLPSLAAQTCFSRRAIPFASGPPRLSDWMRLSVSDGDRGQQHYDRVGFTGQFEHALTRGRRIGKFFVSRGCQEQGSPASAAAADEPEQP